MTDSSPGDGSQSSRPWRALLVALGFTIFGLGGVGLSLVLLPLLLVPVRIRHKQVVARGLIAASFRLFVRLLRHLSVLDYSFHNAQILRSPNQLIIANHPSLLDVVFLIGWSYQANCVVKGSHWRNPFISLIVRTANYIRNDQSGFIQASVDALNRGESLIIFPEGTRTRPGQPLHLNRGAAEIALSADIGITPVVIHCDPPLLPKSQKWYQTPREPSRFTLHVHDTIPLDAYTRQDSRRSAATRRALSKELASFFEQELQSHPPFQRGSVLGRKSRLC